MFQLRELQNQWPNQIHAAEYVWSKCVNQQIL